VIVVCNDSECKHHGVNGCKADVIYCSTDRFCVTGRRKERNYTKELMEYFKPNCNSTNRGFKSNHGKVIK